jgi:hypothetical protein
MENPFQLQRRCPRLGGIVSFDYCMKCGDGERPCWKIMDCWWETFDIVLFLKQSLSKEEFEHLTRLRPKPKVTSIIELIQKAQASANPEVDEDP